MTAGTNRRTLLMLATAVGLGVLVYLDRREPPPATRLPHRPEQDIGRPATIRTDVRQEVSLAHGHPLGGLRLADLGETMARPLFEPSRRPPARPPPPPPVVVDSGPKPSAALAPAFRLVGVVTSGDRPLALLSAGGHRAQRVEVGDALGGWKVVRIAPAEVAMQRDGNEIVLRLFQR
ncbi:MAG: hypothetical protein SFW09_22295 [Hyphomicrobiaceae bacterium]|nr:hypothetical protein [Hyphomicrobiaceae bacterium]